MDSASRLLIMILALAAGGATLARTSGHRSGLDQLSPEAQREARSLQPAFEKIERYLGRASVSEGADSLMQRMKHIYKRKKWNLFKKLTKSNRKSSAELVKKALKLFISLPKAASSCDFEGYRVFAQNHIAIGQQRDRLLSRRILEDYSLRHANFCRDKYITNFQEMQKHHLDHPETRGKMATVEQIFGALKTSNCMRDSRGYNEQAKDLVITSPICIKQLMRQVLIVRKAKAPELSALKGGFEVIWNGVRDAFDEYLVSPCRDYHHQYKDIFAPLIYDAATMNDSADQLKFMRPKEGQFGEALQTFMACRSIIEENLFLQRMMAAQIPQTGT